MKRWIFFTVFSIFFLSNNLYPIATLFPDKKPMINTHTVLFNSFQGLDVLYLDSLSDRGQFMGANFAIKSVLLHIMSNDRFEMDFTVLGRASARFRLGSQSFNLIHADWVGGLGLDIRYRNFIFETVAYHTSSHLGDDAIVLENEAYINAGWEAIRHYINYQDKDWLLLSLGFEYKASQRPANINPSRLTVFLGFLVDFLDYDVPIFIESEGEFLKPGYGPNIGVKMGFYLHYLVNNLLMNREVLGKKRHILFFQYYYGYSKIGYQANRKENMFIIGRTFRF